MSEAVDRKTPLNDVHRSLGGKMVSFGGWDMPVRYRAGDLAEHNAVRQRVGLFDVSHMGRFSVTDRDAFNFINHLTTNDVSKLKDGQAQYSLLCAEDGGVIDDLLVYKQEENLLLVVNAGNRETDLNWLRSHSQGFDAQVWDESDSSVLLAIQGPRSVETLSKLASVDVSRIGRYRFIDAQIDGVDAIISRTGYTGEDGFELWFDSMFVQEIWDQILEVGKEFDILPCGLGARNTLRLEAGMALYGHELTREVTPLMAGLDRWVKLDKDDFIGREAMIKRGREKLLTGFSAPTTEPIPRDGYPVLYEDREVGKVASGSPSPTLNLRIGTVFLPEELTKVGTPIQIQVRDGFANAATQKLPFYQRAA